MVGGTVLSALILKVFYPLNYRSEFKKEILKFREDIIKVKVSLFIGEIKSKPFYKAFKRGVKLSYLSPFGTKKEGTTGKFHGGMTSLWARCIGLFLVENLSLMDKVGLNKKEIKEDSDEITEFIEGRDDVLKAFLEEFNKHSIYLVKKRGT